MDWLMSVDYGIIIQIIASAVIFGVAHGAWVLLRGEIKIALPVILSTTVLGGLLAILYIVAGRNQIGRASCRERVWISEVAEAVKEKITEYVHAMHVERRLSTRTR